QQPPPQQQLQQLQQPQPLQQLQQQQQYGVSTMGNANFAVQTFGSDFWQLPKVVFSMDFRQNQN
ncbi:unnamed protein product, partial [Adineta steineri]